MQPEPIVFGVCLIALGVVWFLANLGLIGDALSTLRRWWPSSLILWGTLELMRWRAATSRGGAR